MPFKSVAAKISRSDNVSPVKAGIMLAEASREAPKAKPATKAKGAKR